MKQNATYYKIIHPYRYEDIPGSSVTLMCAYHDREDLRNKLVHTSRVLSYDVATGTIETQNTIYRRTQ